MECDPKPARSAAWYAASLAGFREASTDAVIGALVRSSRFPVDESQRLAWEGEIAILREQLDQPFGFLWLEFDVPRLGSRIDAVVVIGPVVVPIEFKVGARDHARGDLDQAWDYALDLRNFHRGSHTAPIFPVLVATESLHDDEGWQDAHADGVRPPRSCTPTRLRQAIAEALTLGCGPNLDASWGEEPYQPTPTIVQAARALYARHSVKEISRSDASARNLAVTAGIVESIIADSQRHARKSIVFVTGVPGAGKTLVGLDVATRHRRALDDDPAHAVFLSGNGPLVSVLREALTRDELERRRARGLRTRKGDVAQEVKPFIQNVHHFRDEGLRTSTPPHEHVVVFDEAQRAWDRDKTARFMKSRKGRAGFDQSEPEFQLDYMDRFTDWAVAVCLVGGGQEIHDGEAGIATWLDAVRDRFRDWHVHLSTRLSDSEYGATPALERLGGHPHVTPHDDLHLAVSMRSFRAEHLSGFVKAVLDRDEATARVRYRELQPRYPLVATRDLQRAKEWVRRQARGTERFGLVASSQAERLKPHAIDVRAAIDPVHWFLDERDDTRSSYYLEDAATEFQVQGLELDWVCATWDADLRMSGSGWLHHQFHGNQWKQVRNERRRRYQLNAYRVLLTRARQGMAIFVPPGDPDDPTRLPEFYDDTYCYLTSLGVEQI